MYTQFSYSSSAIQPMMMMLYAWRCLFSRASELLLFCASRLLGSMVYGLALELESITTRANMWCIGNVALWLTFRPRLIAIAH